MSSRFFIVLGLGVLGLLPQSTAFGMQEKWPAKRDVIKNQIGFSVWDFSQPDGEKPDDEKRKSENLIPILHFHGTSSSRREPELVTKMIREKKRMVISFDRPGYGDTYAYHFQSLDDFDQWADQKLFPSVKEILGFEPKQFDIVSASGGAIYSLRVAQKYPKRVRKLTLLSAGFFARPVGGEGQFEKARWLAANRPRIAELIVKFSRKNPGLTQKFSKKKLSCPDKLFYEQHQTLADLIFDEATQCGAAGIIQDARLQLCDTSYAKPIPEEVKAEIWNGACDNTISVESARLLSERTGIELNIIQNEGHVSSIPISFQKSVLSANLTR